MSRFRWAALAAVLAFALSACGFSATQSGGGSTPSAPSEAGGAFPAVVKTKFGDVTVAAEPKRIVALGWGDAEAVLALGGQPVGASDWLGFGEQNYGVGPWAKSLYQQAPQLIATMEPSYEAIGALQPDLILDVKSTGDKGRYDRLTQIAPTIGVPEGGDSYLATMQQQLEMIATAMGKTDQAKQLLAEIDDSFAKAAAAHPDWKGKTVTAATRTSETWGAYIDGSERVTFLKQLGFVQNPKISAIETAATGFSVNLSSEQLDQMDADLIVAFPIFIPTTQITDDQLWKQIPAVGAGHALVIDGDLSQAYSLGGALSTKYAIDNLVPMIEKALPST